MKFSSLLFCAAALAGSMLVAYVAFPYAAMTPEQATFVRTPQSAELFDDVDLGEFGEIPVLDMVQHYIDSPPIETGSDSGKKVRFQGC